MTEKYDVGIIGLGVAGTFAFLKSHKHNVKVVGFDIGRPPGKRRRQLEGFLGCLPNSDGKFYINDKNQFTGRIDGRKLRAAKTFVDGCLESFGSVKAADMKIIQDRVPNASFMKIAKSHGFEVFTNDYIQWKPENIHLMSKTISEDQIEGNNNLTLNFDNEIHSIKKEKNGFTITSDSGDTFCKKLLISAGRSGWRWVNKFYHSLGLLADDSMAKFGIRIECPASQLKDLNKSHCTLKRGALELGPFSWGGSVIPEDHADVQISAFRSNEDRWKSDKVSFSLIENRVVPNGRGIIETDRLAKLALLMFDDTLAKEKLSSILKKDSELLKLPEYGWLVGVVEEICQIMPNLVTKGVFRAPEIVPMCAQLELDGFKTDIDGLYVAGESAGIKGLYGAALSGTLAMDNICK